ncbi:MAG: four helix bundle protein [Desulfobacterales bacterium]|nr:four helix bundle protein [Desulfobacterales bacterium]
MSFKELSVWQQARDLSVEIYKVTHGNSFSRDFGLRDQMRRAAVSIASNIAEGDERGSNKDSVRFLYIAKGSLAELETQLDIANKIGYLDIALMECLNEKCVMIGKMLGSLIKARS